MAINCYQPPCEPGMMCLQVCRETETTIASRDDTIKLYEAHMAEFMGNLKEAYTKYVQTQADSDLVDFQIKSISLQLAAENEKINAGLMVSPDYLNMLASVNSLKFKAQNYPDVIAQNKTDLDFVAFEISNYLAQVKENLELFSIPTATFEQVYSVVKGEVALPPTYSKPLLIPLPPLTLKQAIAYPSLESNPEPQSMPLADLTRKMNVIAQPKTNLGVILAGAVGLFFLVRKR